VKLVVEPVVVANVAVAAVVAVVALPSKFAVIVFAIKLPALSLLTIASGVFALVASFASMVAAATFAAVCPPTSLTTVALCVPVTSPLNGPVKLVAIVAVVAVPADVAVVALPSKFAVIMFAIKLPDASRLTIASLVFALVASFASMVAAATFAAVCPPTSLTTVALCVPVTSPLNGPVKFVVEPVVVANVAVVALPSKLAVIMFAIKLPDASRLTIASLVFALVASFASMVAAATFAAVCPPTSLTTVAPCVPVTSPPSDPVKFIAVVAVVALPFTSAFIVVALNTLMPLKLLLASSVTPDSFTLVAPLVVSVNTSLLSTVNGSTVDTLPAPDGVLNTKLPVPSLSKKVPAAPTVEGQPIVLPFFVIPFNSTFPRSSINTEDSLILLPFVITKGTLNIPLLVKCARHSSSESLCPKRGTESRNTDEGPRTKQDKSPARTKSDKSLVRTKQDKSIGVILRHEDISFNDTLLFRGPPIIKKEICNNENSIIRAINIKILQ